MKISFCDFWWKFDNKNNFFVDSLKHSFENVEVVEPEMADLVFFSCFGKDHEKVDRTKTKKVYFTGENTRPPLVDCDYSLTFDYESHDGKNFRLPLWMLQIDWWETGGYSYTNPQFVVSKSLLTNPSFSNRENFCCTVFNRDHTGLRVRTLQELSNYKSVHCFGEPWNNWFYGEDKKLSVLSNFRFTLCYENSSYPGYYTEKPFHARVAGCIPIYWSDSSYETDFNPHGFLNLCNFTNISELSQRVIEIDNSESLRKSMVEQPIFSKTPEIESYLKFMQKIAGEM